MRDEPPLHVPISWGRDVAVRADQGSHVTMVGTAESQGVHGSGGTESEDGAENLGIGHGVDILSDWECGLIVVVVSFFLFRVVGDGIGDVIGDVQSK